MLHIGVDLMGGEANPTELFKALQPLCTSEFQDIAFTFYTSEEIAPLIQGATVSACKQVVTMDDNPLVALRKKAMGKLRCSLGIWSCMLRYVLIPWNIANNYPPRTHATG